MILDDSAIILRLVWHPAHFENGKLLGSAFDKGDLDCVDPSRHVSVDREDLLSQAAVDFRIQRQGGKCRRETALFGRAVCFHIRSATLDDGNTAFAVEPDPVLDDSTGYGPCNIGHCVIKNVTGKKSRAVVNLLRAMLVQRFSDFKKYEDYFSESSSPRSS